MGIDNKTMRSIAAAVLVLGGTGGAAAATTTLYGTHVDFSIDSPLGLFGEASLAGDSLVFTPTQISQSGQTDFYADGSSLFASQTVHITVTAHSGYQLSGFSLSESGGYALDGGRAWIGGDLKAIDIEGSTADQLAAAIVGSPLVGGGGEWTAAAAIVLPPSGWGGTDSIVASTTLTLTNQLFALGAAEIWKSGATVAAITAPVPEAETYLMMLAGLVMVSAFARRRA